MDRFPDFSDTGLRDIMIPSLLDTALEKIRPSISLIGFHRMFSLILTDSIDDIESSGEESDESRVYRVDLRSKSIEHRGRLKV